MNDDVAACDSVCPFIVGNIDVDTSIVCNKVAGHHGVHAWYRIDGDVHASFVWWTDKRKGRK